MLLNIIEPSLKGVMTMKERKILIADDDPDILELISEILAENNFKVLTTDNGCAVIQKAQTEHPGLIILDIMLPELDGYTICERLKKLPETKDIPILVISAHLSKQMIFNLYAIGIKYYLCKPFDINELLNQVNYLYKDNFNITRN